MIVAYRAKRRAILVFGFAKNERENIGTDELIDLRELAENWLAASGAKIQRELENGNLQEVENGGEA